MKKMICFLLIFAAGSIITYQANAQLLKRIKNEVKNRAENHVINDAGNVTDKTIDKTEDAVTKGITENKGNEDNESAQTDQTSSPATATPAAAPSPAKPATVLSYKNYDFVPGDKIIFQTNFKDQQDAELPARLGTLNGNAEIQTYKSEKVLHLSKGNKVTIIPMIDSANYLSDQFTVEFDFMYNAPDPKEFNSLSVQFYNSNKTQRDLKYNDGDYHFLIYEARRVDFGPSIQGKDLQQDVINDLLAPDVWHHVAIYLHNNIGKAYIDQYRVAASNMMTKGATKLALKTDGRIDYLIKNIRIAGGGSDAYNKIMTEGKFITHGIHFASGMATILPESMGTINKVYTLLQNHADLKLEIDGYTDNDGSDDLNLKLSEQRAEAVKAQLVSMGITDSRLTTKGFGESNPIDSNDTPEGKSNNRRVEFVKK